MITESRILLATPCASRTCSTYFALGAT